MPSPVVLIMRRAARGGGGIRTRDLSCPAGGTARKNLTYISSGAGPAAPDRIRKAAPAGQDTIPSGADRRRRKIRRGAGGLQPRDAARVWTHVGIVSPRLTLGDRVRAGRRSSLVSGGVPRPSGNA